MAITINIYYSGESGNAKKFVREMVSSGVVNSIRAEEGNLRYEYFFPMDGNDTVLLIDSWQKSALDVHHSSPMMEKIAPNLINKASDMAMQSKNLETTQEQV